MTTHSIITKGCKIAYSFFAGPAAASATLVLVHEHSANRYWWSHLTDELARSANVIAIDLSGAGDSGHRRRYSPALHATEIAAAIEACAVRNRIVLVAHGSAFHTALDWARTTAAATAEIVLIDPVCSAHAFQSEVVPLWFRLFARRRAFAEVERALEEFRRTHTTFGANPELLATIVEDSLTRGGDSLKWKADPFYFSKFEWPSETSMSLTAFSSLRIQWSIVYGALSATFNPAQRRLAKTLISEQRLACVGEAGHSVFLDQPRSFTIALKNLTRDRDYSRSSNVVAFCRR